MNLGLCSSKMSRSYGKSESFCHCLELCGSNQWYNIKATVIIEGKKFYLLIKITIQSSKLVEKISSHLVKFRLFRSTFRYFIIDRYSQAGPYSLCVLKPNSTFLAGKSSYCVCIISTRCYFFFETTFSAPERVETIEPSSHFFDTFHGVETTSTVS